MAYVPFGSLAPTPAQSMQAPAVEQNFLQQVAGSPGFGNALQALGVSLMSSPSNNPLQGFAPALQNAQDQTERERQIAMQEEERAAAEAEKAQWAQYAQSVVPEQLKGLAQTDPKGALTIWQQMQPEQVALTAEQRNWQYAQTDPAFAAAYGLTGEPPTPEAIAEAQNRETLAGRYGLTGDAAQQFILTGDIPKASGTGVPMNATIQKEIFETDDAILSGQSAIGSLNRALELSKTAYEGPLADQRAVFGGVFGDEGAQDTQLLRTEVTSNALNQMKAIFGGNPTEGERAILLEIQGAASQPKAVRDEIYRRGIQMANRRLTANQKKAAGLRDGTYFGGGYDTGGSDTPLGSNMVPEGVDPTDWEYMSPEERSLWQQ